MIAFFYCLLYMDQKSFMLPTKAMNQLFLLSLGLNFNIQKTKIMGSGPITSWEIDGKQWKQCQTLFWGGSKITADGDCSHEIKRHLFLERKVIQLCAQAR